MIEPTKIYLNGQLVGEVPAGRDEEEQYQLALTLLKSKGLYQPTTMLQALFRQAVSFATTASYLYNRDLTSLPRNGMSLAPFIVNGSFAIELYLKSLGHVHGKSSRGHDLLVLFDALPDAAREEIVAHFESSQWRCGISTQSEFREPLERCQFATCASEQISITKISTSNYDQLQLAVISLQIGHQLC